MPAGQSTDSGKPLLWELGIKLVSARRGVSALSHWTLSLAHGPLSASAPMAAGRMVVNDVTGLPLQHSE